MTTIVSIDNIVLRECKSLLKLWSVSDLNPRLEIQWSSRMKTTLGLAYPRRSLIRLNKVLSYKENRTLLLEAICHELAHLVIHDIYGISVNPHGSEWRSLIQKAGYEPRTSIPAIELTQVAE